jgi:beta-1,4-mannosyltransferase
LIRVGTAPVPASTTYTSLLYAAVETAGATVDDITVRKLLSRRYEIVHLHWPEWYLYRRPFPRMVARSATVLVALAWARRRGARVVWTAHNVFPHERVGRRFGKWFFWVFTGLVDAVVSPTESGLEPLRRRFPRLARKSMTVIPLGHLRGRYSDHGSRAMARERFGIDADAEVATFFGHVRPYKNVDRLVREFRRVTDPDAVLLIGGRPLDDAVRADIEDAAGDDGRIRLHLGYVEDDDVQHFMRAADIVVLPYAESSNSFVALLALSFDRPILAPAIGAFPELAATIGPAWVRLYVGDLTAAVLSEALAAVHRTAANRTTPNLDNFSWPTIAAATIGVYRCAMGDETTGTARSRRER